MINRPFLKIQFKRDTTTNGELWLVELKFLFLKNNRTLEKGLGPEIEFKYFYKNVSFCLGQIKSLY